MNKLLFIAALICFGFGNALLLAKARNDIVLMKSEIIDMQQMLAEKDCYD